MKRLSMFLIILVSLMTLVLPVNADDDRLSVLKVYNWADYIDEDLIPEFEEWYEMNTGEKVEVLYQTFDINEVMLTKIETGHEDYDVVCPSEYIIERMLKKDLLLPLIKEFGDVPDYTVNVSRFAQEKFDEISVPGRRCGDYAVGYMWGTTGILYNKSYVNPDDVSSWSVLWRPEYAGHILMKDAFRDVYGSLMMYVRNDDIMSGEVTRDQVMNDLSDEMISLFIDTVSSMKEGIMGWEVDFGKERMTQGKAWMNVTWSGDAMWAMEECEGLLDLGYVIPEEGGNVWFDGWVIPRYAKNRKAAEWFINFMCIPENAIRNMDAIGYVSVISTPEILEAKIDEDVDDLTNLAYFFGPDARCVRINNVQYPDSAVIAHCALMHDSGDRTEAMMDMWSKVKGSSLDTGVLAVTGIFISGVIILLVVKKRKEKKRNLIRKNNVKFRR